VGLVLGAAAALLLLVVALLSLPGRIGGRWEELDAPEKPPIVLARIAFWVKGARRFPDGEERFSGWYILGRLHLKRRDIGVDHLIKQGFPPRIAAKLNGTVMARLDLRLQPGGHELRGTFSPQKIHFTYSPPRITDRYYLPAKPRTGRRLDAGRRRR